MKNNILNHLLIALDKVTEFLGRSIAWLTLVMVLLSFLIVVLRYGFNIGSIAMQESVLYLHAMVFMLGAAYTFKHDGHVRVDIFYQKMSEKQRAYVNLFGLLCLYLPVAIFIFVICFDYVALAWRIQEKSPEAGGLAFVYLNKTLLLLLPITLIIQGIAEVIRKSLIICGSVSEKTEEEGVQL